MLSQVYEFNGTPITFNKGESLMVNATQMAKPFGKRPTDWLKYQQSADFIAALAKVRNVTLDDLVVIRKGGSDPGTWMHEDVALEFARWLSPEFAIWCNDRIKELLLNNRPLSPAELMLQQAHMLVDIEKRQTETEKKLKELDARTATRPDYYYTATGYGIYVGRRISYSEAVRIGKRASQLCREAGLTIDRVRDSKYAWVGSYPEHIP
jgi:hypothetical protein